MPDGASPEAQPVAKPGGIQGCLVSALTRLGVPLVFANGECDQAAVALAIQLRCPIISSDSDFFIMEPYWGEVPGFCFLEFSRFTLSARMMPQPCCRKRDCFYLPCQIFTPETISSQWGTSMRICLVTLGSN